MISPSREDMSSSRINNPLQNTSTEARTTIKVCAALQYSSRLAYLEYCEIPSCSSADAVLKVIEKLGGISWKSRLKQWFLLRKTTISEVDFSFVGTPLPHMSFSAC